MRRRLLWIAGFLALAVALLKGYELSLWLQGRHVEDRHSPVPVEEPLDFATASFDDYLVWSQRRLRAANPESDEETRARLGPYRLEPAANCPRATDGRWPNGIILTHGELESAHSMAALGRQLRTRCFLVLGVLLPGHGTRPGDFDSWGLEAWRETQRLALRELEGSARTIFLGGHSAGASLALLEAAQNPRVDGLLLFSPLLALRAGPVLPRLRRALSWWIPAAGWLRILPDETPYRYESLSLAGWSQLRDLAAAASRVLEEQPPAVPTFTVASMDDESVDAHAVLEILARLPHDANRTLLYSRQPLADAGPRVGIYDSYAPRLSILSLSHLGLMLPQSDPIFGLYGRVHSCRHYWRGDLRRYYLCLEGERDALGEVAAAHRTDEQVLERISFNPWFQPMLASLDAFLRALDFIAPQALQSPAEAR